MYYFYRKSNWGHGICPLYRGCPPYGESVIRGFTILHNIMTVCVCVCVSLAEDQRWERQEGKRSINSIQEG